MRLALIADVSALTRNTVSTLAATTCSSWTPPGRLARQDAPSIEPAMHDRAIGPWRRGDADPVAHRGEIGRRAGVVAKASADLRPAVDVAGEGIQSALLLHHACAQQRCFVSELLLKKRVPPETFQ